MQQPEQPEKASASFKQFIRFISVGFSNFAVSFVTFYLFYNYWKLSGLFFSLLGEAGRALEDNLMQLGAGSLDATLANVIGYGAGIINSFTWNKLWTFQARHETTAQFFRFFVLNMFCLLFSSGSLFFFTDYLAWPYLPVWLVTMTFVTLVNFGVSKYWVFAENDS